MRSVLKALGMLAILGSFQFSYAAPKSITLSYGEFVKLPLSEQASYIEGLREWALAFEKNNQQISQSRTENKSAQLSAPVLWSLLLSANKAWSLASGDTCIYAGYISKFDESIDQCGKPPEATSTTMCVGQTLCNPMIYGYGKPGADGKFSGICTSEPKSPTAACDAQYMSLPDYPASVVAQQIAKDPSLAKNFDAYGSGVDKYCTSADAKKYQKNICSTVSTRTSRQRGIIAGDGGKTTGNDDAAPAADAGKDTEKVAEKPAKKPAAKPAAPAKKAEEAPAENLPAYSGSTGNFDCSSMSVVCAAAVNNCKKAYGVVRNKKALTYTMQFLLANHANNGGLKDASCALASSSYRHGVLPAGTIKKGIQSGRFVLNDMDSGGSGKADGYYVDLCKGEFKTFKTNKGTGTTKKGNGFYDREGSNTTLAGAFLTDTNAYSFTPFTCPGGTAKARAKCAAYRSYLSGAGGKTGLKLVGLNSSNNSSDFLKPMHVTPYRSSIGCPSVNKEDGGAKIIGKMAADGKTGLLVNYHDGVMQNPNSRSCQNGDGREGRGSGGKKTRGAT